MNAEINAGAWFKSSYSAANGNCPQFQGLADGTTAIQDSKDPGPHLRLDRDQLAALLADCKTGGLELSVIHGRAEPR